MGEVYRALDTKFNRPVAVKLLSEELAMPPPGAVSSVRHRPRRLSITRTSSVSMMWVSSKAVSTLSPNTLTAGL